MGLLDSLFGSMTEGEQTASKPCSNCASDCPVCPAACEVCKPYKQQLADLLYDVDHIEEFRARYEVGGTAAAAEGSSNCPACGAPNAASALCCEYCGSQLRESDGKIHVTSASEIPNPILQAQEVIFQRREAVQQVSDSGSEGILDSLLQSLTGQESGLTQLGDRMTEDEITAAAASYGVAVSTYLQGLDNGKYGEAAQSWQTTAQTGGLGTGLGTGLGLGAVGLGTAGLGTAAYTACRSNGRSNSYAEPSYRDRRAGDMPDRGERPPMGGDRMGPGSDREQGPERRQRTGDADPLGMRRSGSDQGPSRRQNGAQSQGSRTTEPTRRSQPSGNGTGRGSSGGPGNRGGRGPGGGSGRGGR